MTMLVPVEFILVSDYLSSVAKNLLDRNSIPQSPLCSCITFFLFHRIAFRSNTTNSIRNTFHIWDLVQQLYRPEINGCHTFCQDCVPPHKHNPEVYLPQVRPSLIPPGNFACLPSMDFFFECRTTMGFMASASTVTCS